MDSKQKNNKFKKHDEVICDLVADNVVFVVIEERPNGDVLMGPKVGGMLFVTHRDTLERIQ